MTKTLLITPKTITKGLLGIVSILLMMHLICIFLIFKLGRERVLDFIEVFYFDKSVSIQAIYSTMAILLSAALLWLISRLKSEQEKKLVTFWKILSMLFLFLSIDELISIHERLDKLGIILIRNVSIGEGYLYFAWYIPYVPLFVIIALFLVKSFFKLPYKFKALFITAGAVFIAGAVGMEMVCSEYYFTNKVFDLNYALLLTLEELLEMLGIIAFIYALSRYYLENIVVYLTVSGENQLQQKTEEKIIRNVS